ncbi:uncharacterized protein LOC118756018 [Rhagoletis pomonella]|uniref:uncharacterized protein LOC118756018 n=1 Tax=Rhagoletis pomonella TaxID=28610 RepID=UPI00177DF8B8|nr:uncharacterized protein LOC118756018 [Rhagoletis pomonella]
MSRSCFRILCDKLKGMAKCDTVFRACIPLEKRVAIALYCLRWSAEYATICRLFGVSKTSVWRILLEFRYEVWNVLRQEYLPSTFLSPNKIQDCVDGFEIIGFPQCFGAIDGCHIEIKPSTEEATDYYNYKGWCSIVLLALVDYRYISESKTYIYINTNVINDPSYTAYGSKVMNDYKF